ncbi:low temperature requirement protein A [Sciscionella marina]|uniref:low temperature requirement protein A n=1 Tax=Sciscionella marina TaxID=508770 RepID=UPI000475FBF0|nr:low temperature requirement protein A [Sciscionella marina]
MTGSILHRRMRAHDPDEPHRAATPLELLFDLAFVVAVGFVVEELAHAVEQGHAGLGAGRFLMVFFAIWWAWVNFSHFGSVYDTDDALYRVLTMVQIGGVLVLAAGVEPAFTEADFTVIVIGYVIMRIAMVCQWLRAAVEYPQARRSSLFFAGGILIVQLGWIGRLFLPDSLAIASFIVLAVLEIAVPVVAESAGGTTQWHPGHLAERYSLFIIIVLGEQVVGSTNALVEGFKEPDHLTELIGVAVGGLVVFMALWWLYFDRFEDHPRTLRGTLTWAYGHYFLLGAIAAAGAGVEVAIVAVSKDVPAGPALAIPVAVYLLGLWLLYGGPKANLVGKIAGPLAAVLILAGAFTPAAFWVTVAVLVILVAVKTVSARGESEPA